MYMDGVPDSAVCNEAVKLARKRRFSGLSGFVNGVLRSIAREWKTVGFPNASVCYSVPEWIVNTWQKDYGKERTTQILEALSTEAKLTVRTNLQKCTPQELKKRLEEEGVTVTEVPEIPYAFALSGLDYLSGLESFRDGWFYVQDVSSMMVAVTAGSQSRGTM